MIAALGFVALAALGAVVRATAGRWLNQSDGFAYGTLVVNVVGSFVLGLLHDTSPAVMTVVGVGFLGALTTFSSFARDVVALAETKQLALSAAYLMLTLALSLGAAALGLFLA